MTYRRYGGHYGNKRSSIINKHANCRVWGRGKIGRLKSTLQQVSTQAITSDERRFAYAVLEHAKNTILNRQDVAKLLPRASNFELSQGKKGEVILKGLRVEQLSLEDAKLLLDAVTRKCKSFNITT